VVMCSFGKSLRRMAKGQPLFREVLSAISPDDSARQTTEPPSAR
jgi:hypothetical protein